MNENKERDMILLEINVRENLEKMTKEQIIEFVATDILYKENEILKLCNDLQEEYKNLLNSYKNVCKEFEDFINKTKKYIITNIKI